MNIHMSSNELTYKWSIEKASPLRTHSSYIDGRINHVWLLASHSFLISMLHTSYGSWTHNLTLHSIIGGRGSVVWARAYWHLAYYFPHLCILWNLKKKRNNNGYLSHSSDTLILSGSLCVRTPFSLPCMCVFVSQKKKILSRSKIVQSTNFFEKGV